MDHLGYGMGKEGRVEALPSLAWILRGLHGGFVFSGDGARETEEKLECAISYILPQAQTILRATIPK